MRPLATHPNLMADHLEDLTMTITDPQPGDDGVTPEEVDAEMQSSYHVPGWATSPIRVVVAFGDSPWTYAIAEVSIFGGAMHLVLGEAIEPTDGAELSWARKAVRDLG